ncbi:MAG: hypothetical protein Tsb009_05380 [Planctomycetaceae bacterium]
MGQDSSSNSSSRSLNWLILLVVGSLAGASVGIVVDQPKVRQHFMLPQELDEELSKVQNNPPQELADRVRKAGIKNDYENAALAVGISGAVLCGVIGGLFGWFRRKTLGLLLGLVVGVILGGALGVGGGIASKWLETKSPVSAMKDKETEELIRAMKMHAAAWGAVGLAAGIAIAVSSRSMKESIENLIVMGIVGGITGAVFPFLSMIVFKTAKVSRPIPDTTNATIFWIALAGGIIGLTAGRLAGRSPKQPSKAETQPETTSDS